MTVRIHLYVVGQVVQSRSLNLLSRPTLSSEPCPLDNDALCPSFSKPSFSTASVVRTLNACAPTPGTPPPAHAHTPKPPSRCPNWTVMAIPDQKSGCPEIGPGGESPTRGLMPRLVPSFPSLLVVRASRPSWLNSMLTPAPPRPALHLPPEVVHAFGLPATAAEDASPDARLTLRPRSSYTLPPISCLIVPLSRFFVIVYLWAVPFIPCFGL